MTPDTARPPEGSPTLPRYFIRTADPPWQHGGSRFDFDSARRIALSLTRKTGRRYEIWDKRTKTAIPVL